MNQNALTSDFALSKTSHSASAVKNPDPQASIKNDLYMRIYEVVSRIPSGRVTTYGAIAGAVGVRSGARVVGYALNHLLLNPEAMNSIPAHRVVNRLGQLTGRGYFPGNSMVEALESEGVTFSEPYCIHLKKHYWDPVTQHLNESDTK